MNGYFSYFVCSFQGAEICVGALLLSRAVSSQVPSAAQVLTIVFGMGTGVSPARISTNKFCYQSPDCTKFRFPELLLASRLPRFRFAHLGGVSRPIRPFVQPSRQASLSPGLFVRSAVLVDNQTVKHPLLIPLERR